MPRTKPDVYTMSYQIILTCEHATNKIPNLFKKYFISQQQLLSSHKGYDIGSLMIAKYLHKYLPADLTCATTSRLLIDYNRSLNNSNCFSFISKNFNLDEKKLIIQKYYLPYRYEVENNIHKLINANKIVLHLSIHSFVNIFNNQIRNNDFGILYDPKKRLEKHFSHYLKDTLKNIDPKLKIRSNYPYRGNADGFTTFLRTRFSSDKYLGIEIECNQKFLTYNSLLAAKLLLQALKNFNSQILYSFS